MKKKAIPATVVNRKAQDALEQSLENKKQIDQLRKEIRYLSNWIIAIIITVLASGVGVLAAYISSGGDL